MVTDARQTSAPPPIDRLAGDIIAALLQAAHLYLQPEGEQTSDLASAEAAIDIAASAMKRLEARFSDNDRRLFTSMLTEVRMEFIRKRDA